MKIRISERGEWILAEIKSYRLIEKTRFSEFPQFVFDLELQDGNIHPVWTPARISSRSKKFTFLTAATGDILLKDGDEIDPRLLVGRKVIGLWGREKGPEPKETFLRFVPYPETEFKPTASDTAPGPNSQKVKLEEFM